jgi:hypothetical protein
MARLVANRVRSIQGIFAHAPRRHAGVRALHHLAVSGRLFQVYWHLRALYDARASEHALLRLALQAISLQRQEALKGSYWEMLRALLRRNDLQFDRAWRELIEPPLLAIGDTRQGRFVLNEYFPGLWTVTRFLLAEGTADDSRHVALQQELDRFSALIDSSASSGALVLFLAGRHIVAGRKGSHWRIVEEGNMYEPTTPSTVNAFLEHLQAKGIGYVVLPDAPPAVDGQPPLFAYIETHLTAVLRTERWTAYDLHSFTGRLREIADIRNTVRDAVPAGASLLVVSKGDEDLLAFPHVSARHFPQTEDGGYAGYNPSDGLEVLRHLEALRSQGAQYLLVPQSAFWWLDFYGELRAYLSTCDLVASNAACRLYRLMPVEVAA